MDLTSPEMQEIRDAIMLPDKQQARAILLQLWEKLSPSGQPMQLCAMAHFLADTESDIASELEWDLRALEAAIGTREPEDGAPVGPQFANLLPSLHLSVANGYRATGQIDRARQHVAFAANHVGALPDDGYGQLIRGGLRRLQAGLGMS